MKKLGQTRICFSTTLSGVTSTVDRRVAEDCMIDWVDWNVGLQPLGDARTWWIGVSTNGTGSLWVSPGNDAFVSAVGGYTTYLPAGTPSGIITGAVQKFCGPNLRQFVPRNGVITLAYAVQTNVNLYVSCIIGLVPA